jgi:ubiquinone/menaquinone biosynthesis C-methylase UbiE
MTYSYTDLLALFGIGGAHPGGLALSRAILEELTIDQTTHFLEVGCGTGQTTGYIMTHYPCQLYAIDNHPIMISKTRKRLQTHQQSAQLLEASAENLPFQDQMFHYLLSESVTVFTNIQASLKEYYRILKDEGVLLLIEMTKVQTLTDQEAQELIKFYCLHQILTEENWVRLLEEAGFQDVEVFSITSEELKTEGEDFTEFDITSNIDPQLFDLLDQHDQLTQQYKDKLGFRVFICKKH